MGNSKSVIAPLSTLDAQSRLEELPEDLLVHIITEGVYMDMNPQIKNYLYHFDRNWGATTYRSLTQPGSPITLMSHPVIFDIGWIYNRFYAPAIKTMFVGKKRYKIGKEIKQMVLKRILDMHPYIERVPSHVTKGRHIFRYCKDGEYDVQMEGKIKVSDPEGCSGKSCFSIKKTLPEEEGVINVKAYIHVKDKHATSLAFTIEGTLSHNVEEQYFKFWESNNKSNKQIIQLKNNTIYETLFVEYPILNNLSYTRVVKTQGEKKQKTIIPSKIIQPIETWPFLETYTENALFKSLCKNPGDKELMVKVINNFNKRKVERFRTKVIGLINYIGTLNSKETSPFWQTNTCLAAAREFLLQVLSKTIGEVPETYRKEHLLDELYDNVFQYYYEDDVLMNIYDDLEDEYKYDFLVEDYQPITEDDVTKKINEYGQEGGSKLHRILSKYEKPGYKGLKMRKKK